MHLSGYLNRLPYRLTISKWPQGQSPKDCRSIKMVIARPSLRLEAKIRHLQPYFQLWGRQWYDCYVNRLPSWLTIPIWPPGKSAKDRRSMKMVIFRPFVRLEAKFRNLQPYFQPWGRQWNICYVNRLTSWLTIPIWPRGKSAKYRRSMKMIITLLFLTLWVKIWHIWLYF